MRPYLMTATGLHLIGLAPLNMIILPALAWIVYRQSKSLFAKIREYRYAN